MKIHLSSVFVDGQDKALRFYTDALGSVKKTEVPLGADRWLTVVSPEDPDGTELLLEPDGRPAVKPYKAALVQDGIPATSGSPSTPPQPGAAPALLADLPLPAVGFVRCRPDATNALPGLSAALLAAPVAPARRHRAAAAQSRRSPAVWDPADSAQRAAAPAERPGLRPPACEGGGGKDRTGQHRYGCLADSEHSGTDQPHHRESGRRRTCASPSCCTTPTRWAEPYGRP